MADDKKELEIRMRATGGDAAAKEVGRVEEALEGVAEASEQAAEATEGKGSASAALAPAWEAAAEAGDGMAEAGDRARRMLDEMRESMDLAEDATGDLAAGQAAATRATGALSGGIRGLGSRLLAMAGGPVGVAMGALAALVAMYQNLRRRSDEVTASTESMALAIGARIDASREQFGAFLAGLDRANSPVETLAGETARLAENQRLANSAWETAARHLAELKDAADDLAQSEIELRVARGEMTAEEGRAAKGEIDIEAMQREVALRRELAAAAKEAAEADERRARAAEAAAAAAAQAARDAAVEAQRRADNENVAAANKELAARQIDGLDPLNPRAAADAIDLAGGEEAVREMVEEMKGLTGVLARARLYYGESLESVLGHGERLAIAEQMAEQAEVEAEAAREATEKYTAAAQQIAAEKAEELAAARRSREAAEKEASAKARAAEQAEQAAVVAEQFTVPAAANRQEAAAEDARRRERERADAEAAKAANAGAVRMAKDIDAQVEAAPNAAGNPELIAALQGIAATLRDGTDSGELASVATDLVAIASGLSAEQAAARAVVARLQSDVATLRSQFQNRPDR